jgi:hypothetical protein
VAHIQAPIKYFPAGKEKEAIKTRGSRNGRGCKLKCNKMLNTDIFQFITGLMKNLEARCFTSFSFHRKKFVRKFWLALRA